MTPPDPQILIVDDDPGIRSLLRLIAQRKGFSVDVASDGIEALGYLTSRRYTLAIIDLMMPRRNGYDLVQDLRMQPHRPLIVVATAMTDTLVAQLDAQIVHSIIRKPFDIETVGALMADLVTAASTQSQSETGAASAADARNNVVEFPRNQPC